jgi:hypothetical protein
MKEVCERQLDFYFSKFEGLGTLLPGSAPFVELVVWNPFRLSHDHNPFGSSDVRC